MLFTSDSYADIDRYFRKTYLKFQETGDTLYFIGRVSPDQVKGVTENGEDFVLYLDNEHPYTVDYVLPRKSCFQYGKHSVILERIPARQYQRGLSSANTCVNRIDGNATPRGCELDFNILKAYVGKQTFPTLQEAVNNKKACISTALSPRFTYVNKASLFLVDYTPVAMREGTSIVMRHPQFTAEMQALAKDSVFKVV